MIASAALLTAIDTISYAGPQITAASVGGIVGDETGGPLPGVAITVRNLDTGFTRSTLTANDGSYIIEGLPPGRYEVRGSLRGFAGAIESRLSLAVAQQATLSLTMRVGASELVIVDGAAAPVDTKTSSLSAVVEEQAIRALPLNGRNFIDLAPLQTGVAAFNARQRVGPTGRGQQLNINGANGRANSYLLDGANMSSYAGVAVATAADTTLGVDLIREFRVVTSTFSADYGRAMGGVVSVVTKSGTNAFHGSGFEFFRHHVLDARNHFDVDQPPFERHQFGFTAGGPILENRTFFFAGGEWVVEDLTSTQVTEVPSLAARAGALGPVASAVQPYLELFPLPNGADLGDGFARFSFPFDRRTRETYVQARVDHNLSSVGTLFVRYTADRGTSGVPTSLPQFSSEQRSRNEWVTVEERHSIHGSLLNTSRFSYSNVKLAARLTGAGAGPELSFVPAQPLVGNLVIGSREYGYDRFNPQHQDIEYFTFSDDVVGSVGRHLLKWGAIVERANTDTENSTNVRGRFTFPNVQRFIAGTPSRFIGVLPGYDVARSRRSTTFGVYVQDDLTAHARLALNLGLRYEFYTVPNDIYGRDSALRNPATDSEFTVGPVFENPSLRNFGPRAGFAWDVLGDGKTSVRGGAGVYYDTDGTFNSALLAAAFSSPFAYPLNLANPTFPRSSFDRPERSVRAVDYHIQQPRMLIGNVNVQREAPGQVIVTIAYAGSLGYNLVQDIEGNPVIPEVLADGTRFFAAGAPRTNTHWDSIDFKTAGGRSKYNALHVNATKRFGKGYAWQASYTLGKAVDDTQGQVSADSTNSSVFPQDPFDPRSDRGPADFDVRHVLAMNVTWTLPSPSFTGLTAALTRGWQVSGLGMLRSGVPFSPAIQSQSNWSRSGNVAAGAEDRPNVRSGVGVDDIVLGGSARYFDPNAFELQPRGFLGNAGRNMLTGPGLVNVDMALIKTGRWRWLGNDGRVELRLEAFNVFNRTNLGIPNRVVFSGADEGEAPLPTAGQITTLATEARQIQLGVKVSF